MVAVILLGAAAGLRMANANGQCAGNLPAQTTMPWGERACPAVGAIGKVKLGIPPAYLFGPVAYKGDDIWSTASTRSRERPPSFEREIENFAILVRLSDFRPIETKRDWEDFNKFESLAPPAYPRAADRWITVGFKSNAAYVGPGCGSSMQCYFNGILKDDAGWGPFILQREKAYGLDHYLSLQRPTAGHAAGLFDEFFYDPGSKKTLITCSSKPMTVPPHVPLEYCEHHFVIPELDAQVNVGYFHPSKEELPRWQEVEQHIRRIVKSFIVAR